MFDPLGHVGGRRPWGGARGGGASAVCSNMSEDTDGRCRDRSAGHTTEDGSSTLGFEPTGPGTAAAVNTTERNDRSGGLVAAVEQPQAHAVGDEIAPANCTCSDCGTIAKTEPVEGQALIQTTGRLNCGRGAEILVNETERRPLGEEVLTSTLPLPRDEERSRRASNSLPTVN